MTTKSDGNGLICGVDGGGTRCRARIRRADGTLLGEGFGGRANLYASVDDSLTSIMEAVRTALGAGGLDTSRVQELSCGLGLAGANVVAAQVALRARLPFATCRIVTDGAAALAGAFGGKDGAIAILGTGAAYMARENGELREVGGWGFHVGDQGSGADLGRLVLRRTLLAHDGVVPKSALTEAVLLRFKADPLALITFARDATPAEYGALAPLVLDHAEAGDSNGKAVLDEALMVVKLSLRSISAQVDRLCLLGGLAARYRPFLESEFGQKLQAPQADAMDGAILLMQEALARKSALAAVG
jgi:glucosamine kinase